jgi:citrate synthase
MEVAMTDGLEGVVAAETVLSDVDGRRGRLVIRGLSLDDLAGTVTFEAVVRLLLDGFFADLPDARAMVPVLATARSEVFRGIGTLDQHLLALPLFDAVRALTARLADGDDLVTALRLLAAPAVFTPALLRARRGLAPIPPDPTLGHAADILAMLAGPAVDAAAAALDAYLVTISDHGLNASTFAARVVASTHAGLTSCVLAGLSALKGPLHGGAPGPVIEMLDEIGAPDNARPWLEAAVARGDRLMGFGHRIYHVRDPRADALKLAVRALIAASGGSPGRLAFAESVEAAALAVLRERKPKRSLETNVEFYTALLLEALGFPPETFTCVFAMGRTIGWLAHAREQVARGRLIRPDSRYVGPTPQRAA